MSNVPSPIPPLGAARPAADYEKAMQHHPAAKAPPPFKMADIKGILGAAPLEAVEVAELFATIPANLGPNIDTTA